MNVDLLILAARLVNPMDEERPDIPEGKSAERLVGVLARNKYPVISLKRKLSEELTCTPMAAKLAQEESLFKRLRGEFERVKSRFSGAHIEMLLVKSSYLSPSFPYLSSNLDVLVRAERGDDARKLLCELGYVELLNVEEPNKFLFRRFAGDGFSYTFHLHEKIGWGVPFVDERRTFDEARAAEDDAGIIIPSPEDALLITLAHWFYEDKELSLWNLFATASALRRLSVPIDRLAERAGAMGWGEGFFAALDIFNTCWEKFTGSGFFSGREADLVGESARGNGFIRDVLLPRVEYFHEVPARIPFLANKVAYYRKLAVDPSRSPGQRAKDWAKTLLWAVRWKFHIRSQKPFLVAVSGCDGSGKTVQTGKLKKTMETCDIRCRVVWARGGSSGFASFLTRTAKKFVGKNHGEGFSGRRDEASRVARRRSILKNPLWRFLYGLLLSMDLAWTLVLKTRLHLLTGRAVICDRYIGDALVDLAVFSGGERLGRPVSFKILGLLAPSPDVCFLLDVEEREALTRKPEEGGMEHLLLARTFFKHLAESEGWRIVPADLSLGEVHELIALESLERFYVRYRTLLNWVLFSNPGQVNPGRWRQES